jgi:hypothetical protein
MYHFVNFCEEYFPESQGLQEEILQTFQTNIMQAGLDQPSYIGWDMVIQREYAEPLIETITESMQKILGFNFGDLVKEDGTSIPFVTNVFTDISELLEDVRGHILLHRLMGMDILGFYDKRYNSICVRVGSHLDIVIRVLFHELAHAYLHQHHITFKDSWTQPMETVSAFRDQMRDTDQCEGFCEMVVTIMFYRLFKKEKYLSNVKEYWMGWRLCMQALNHFFKRVQK